MMTDSFGVSTRSVRTTLMVSLLFFLYPDFLFPSGLGDEQRD